MRVLLVEDNPRMGELMRQSLHAADYAVDLVRTADAFREAAASIDYDLFVVDLGLPDGDGVELVRESRRSARRTPVLIVSARGDVQQKVRGLDAGADDYLVKPFYASEMLARVRALLRRPAPVEAPILRAGGLELDSSTGEIRCEGERVEVRRSERRLLAVMIRRSGKLVTKAMLEQALAENDQDVTANAIEQLVSRVRKTLNELPPARSTIRTLRGSGYVLEETA